MTNKTMKVYWNDCGRGVASESAIPMTVEKVNRLWSDEIRGVEGNFLGLIDDADCTIQFYFQSGIPDDVDDASRLAIVLLDFPVPAERGSYCSVVKVGDVSGLIAKAFQLGAKHSRFDVRFQPW